MPPETDQRNLAAFLQCTTCFHCARNLRLSFRNAKTFAEDGFLSLDFANDFLVDRTNSFYFYAIKLIMQ